MAKSPEELAHQEWLGYVQPVGLIVSIPAMLEAQCYVNKNIMAEHAQFLSCLPKGQGDERVPELRDLPEFTRKVLGWEAADLREVSARVPLPADMASLEVVLPQYNETLRPTNAVPVFKPAEGQAPWMMLIQELAVGCKLDEPDEADSARHWNAAPQAKFERLLRETGVPIGLLSNRKQLRLVYAPKGESSGYATFNVQEMMQVAGRPMFAALHMLLCADRMFSLGDYQRLPAILHNSRKYQNTVSTKLAEQVLAALYELMRGFQAANDVRNGDLLREVLANDPNHVYAGLLRVLMRLVFVMYAEDRDLLSSDPIYSNYYSVTGLFNRLREDAGRHPDTMNQRYGAWSQLLTLFRLIYEGGQHGDFRLPARKGYLFDPDRYPFLEGRSSATDAAPIVPRVSDGVVYKVLRNLLILDGERLSYRTLDVEQIGSVYETVMGFNLEVARGRSIAIKPVKSHGAPATINLSELLKTPGKDRAKWLKEHSDQTLGKEAAKQLREAESLEQLLEALDKKIAKKVTPRTVPKGAIVLQPSDERRRSGSHYTPRSLTEPIVRTTLEPILKQLCDPEAPLPEVYQPSKEDKRRYTQGEIDARIRLSERAIEQARQARAVGTPHPSQILDLKICDPAMGSGAFLVEACRQLADELVKAWYAHTLVPTDIPPDEDEVLYARRQVAQRCLYGVDKNEMAVDLAKLSLWLVTLAKDHPFTFLDHSLRHGDSLVGLTRKQIIGFHWEPKKQKQFGEDLIQKRLDRATEARAKILNAREDVPYRDQEQRLALADEALNVVRMTGDACISAFFAGKKAKEREKLCEELFLDVARHFQALKEDKFDVEARSRITNAAASLRTGERPIPPFHWEIEFPEVFSRANAGFDAFVGNPPFMAKNTISNALHRHFGDYLLISFSESNGKSDIVSFFFRLAFEKLRNRGCLGLIATKTIAQGDTRSAGLTFIATHGGVIFCARKKFPWPGVASVAVSVVHISRGEPEVTKYLDGQIVDRISAFLFFQGSDTDPAPQRANLNHAFQGCNISGQGFLFDDGDDGASPTSVMRDLIENEPEYATRIRPFVGGTEINSRPGTSTDRFVIGFGRLSLEEVDDMWPKLVDILRAKVKPDREGRPKNKQSIALAKRWWQWHTDRPTFQAASEGMSRIIVGSMVTAHFCFIFQPTDRVFGHTLNLFALDSYSAFASMQSRVHEIWVRFFASSLEDRLRYTITDSFETFPFPERWKSRGDLETIGSVYDVHRSQLMQALKYGLTDIYNHFHDPHEKSPEILKLRELHEAMDRAVLEAYGWHDLARTARCEFLLDYEEDDEETGKKKSKKKKPWRLRWPDDFRDEVLARLLELNEQRHKEELLAGKQLGKTEKPPKPAKASQPKKLKRETSLFDMDEVSSIDQLTESERMTLVIISAWGEGTMIDRLLFGEAAVLWVNDKHRQYRCGESSTPQKRFKPAPDVTQLIGKAVRRGWITPVMRGEIECVKLIVNPSPLGPLTDDEEAKRRQICQIVAAELNRTDPRVQKGDDYVRATALFARS